MEEELSLSNARCQTQGGGTILLQLLEFKTHLLETFEELHIRRVRKHFVTFAVSVQPFKLIQHRQSNASLE